MPTITFDTHKFIRRLREAGISEEQAEAIAEAFREANLRRILQPEQTFENSSIGLLLNLER